MSEHAFVADYDAKLVRMANQIGTFFESQPEDRRVSGIVDHIRKFWDKRMRRGIYAIVDHGGAGLHPTVVEAIAQMRTTDTAA